MLHIKFYDNRPTGSREEDFKGFFFTLYGMTVVLVMWQNSHFYYFFFLKKSYGIWLQMAQ